MSEKYPVIQDLGDMVILRGELGSNIIYDIAGKSTPSYNTFLALFTPDPKEYLGDPTDSFYQVITFTRIITRNSDGRKFGFTYASAPGHDGFESDLEQDTEELGVTTEYDEKTWEVIGGTPYVFLPVQEFYRLGYEVVMPATEED